MPSPDPADDRLAPAPAVPDSWDEVFALFHQVWGEAKCAQYSKRKWGVLHLALSERAQAAGYRPKVLRDPETPTITDGCV